GAQAARCAACSRLRRSIRGAQGRRAGGEEPARRGSGGLPARAREGRPRRQPVPRERAHAARGARRLSVLRWTLASCVALLAACSSPSGPKPAALEQLSDPRSVRVLWSANVGRADRFTFFPALVGDSVYAAARDGTLARFDVANGEERWRTSVETRLSSGVGADLRTAAVATEAGGVIAVDPAKGEVRWEATVALPKGATELERVTDVVGDPAIQGQEVCAAAYQGRVACYEVANGKPLWARDVSSLTGVSLDARYAFVSDDRGAVHALDRSNGRSVWKQDKLANRQLSVPLAAGSAIAVGDLEGYVHFLA